MIKNRINVIYYLNDEYFDGVIENVDDIVYIATGLNLHSKLKKKH